MRCLSFQHISQCLITWHQYYFIKVKSTTFTNPKLIRLYMRFHTVSSSKWDYLLRTTTSQNNVKKTFGLFIISMLFSLSIWGSHLDLSRSVFVCPFSRMFLSRIFAEVKNDAKSEAQRAQSSAQLRLVWGPNDDIALTAKER